MAGGHVSVLLEEVLKNLFLRPGGVYVDATFGAGGMTYAMLQQEPTCTVVAIDRDAQVLNRVSEEEGRVRLVHASFAQMADYVSPETADGIIMDLGVSSMQLDSAKRGFSFQQDGPLDMRMDQTQTLTAQAVVNDSTPELLQHIFAQYGEEKWAHRIAQAICLARPLVTTRQLASLIERTIGFRYRNTARHPATRCFQALRIYVNDELGQLEKGLEACEKVLKPGGRLLVISFHSLEDRIVKHFFQKRSLIQPNPSRYALPAPNTESFSPSFKLYPLITPTAREIAQNPRARSAKLRVATKLENVPPRT